MHLVGYKSFIRVAVAVPLGVVACVGDVVSAPRRASSLWLILACHVHAPSPSRYGGQLT
jgi:hypothetical protein